MLTQKRNPDAVSEVSSAYSGSASGLVAVDDYDRSGGASALFFSRGSTARRIVEALCFMGIQTQKRALPRKLETIIWSLEMIQFAVFSFSPAAVAGTPLERVFSIMYLIRNPLGPTAICYPAVFWVSVALSLMITFIILVQFFLVITGDTGIRAIYFMLAWFIAFQRILTVPVIYFLYSPLGTSYGTTAITAIALIVVCISFTFVILASAFLGHWRPTVSNAATSVTAYFAFYTTAKITLVGVSCFLRWLLSDSVDGSIASTSTVIAEGIILIIFSICVLVWLLIALPYQHVFFNIGAVATFSGLLWGGIATIAGVFGPNFSWRLGWGIANIACCGVFASLGCLAAFMRIRHPDLPLPWTGTPEIDSPSFRSHVAYELAARNLTNRRKQAAGMIDRADALFQEGIQAFPDSAYLKLHYAVFLLEYKADIPKLRMLMKTIVTDRMHRPGLAFAIVFYFVTSCLKQSTVTDEDQNELESAELHRSAAVEKLAEFWGRVARSKKLLDHNALLDLVTDLMEHERIADRIYRRVLARNVHSPAVMRQYARFLDEVRDERERAELLYQEADKNEDRADRQEKKKKKTKGQTKGIHFGGEEEPLQLPGVVVTETEQQHSSSPAPEDDGDEDEEDEDANDVGRERNDVQLEDVSEHSKEARSSKVVSSTTRSSAESLASSASAATSMEERIKLAEYRTKIASVADRGMTKAVGFVIGFALTLYITFLVSFVLSTEGISTLQKGSAIATDLTSTINTMHESMFSFLEERHEAGFNVSKLEMQALLMQAHLFAASDNSYSDEINGTADTGSHYIVLSTLWDTLNLIVDKVQTLSTALSVDSNADIRPHPAMRFLFDNSITATDLSISASTAVCAQNQLESKALSTKLAIYIGVTCGICLTFLCIAVVPLVNQFEKKRRGIAHVFSEIPKSASMNIFERLQRQNKRQVAHHEGFSIIAGKKLPLALKMALSLVFFSVLLSLFACSTAAVFYSTMTSSADYDAAVVEGGKQKSFFLVLRGTISILSRPLDNDALLPAPVARMVIPMYVSLIRESDDAFELGGVMEGDMLDLWYSRECPQQLADINVTCRGLDQFLTKYLDAAIDLSQSTLPMASNPSYKLVRVGYPHLLAWLTESQGYLYDRATAKARLASQICTWLMIVSVPVLIAGLAVILPTVSVLVSTTNRALNLLLLVPLNVLNREENLKAFLESTASAGTTTMKMLMDDQEKKNRLILEACDDALIIADGSGVIETVNPAAERLVNKTADELIGTKISALMSMETAHIFDRSLRAAGSGDVHSAMPVVATAMTAGTSASAAVTGSSQQQGSGNKRKSKVKRSFTIGDTTNAAFIGKDGTSIAVLLTVLVASTGDGTIIATFVRDIRRIKEREAEYERERRRVDALLLNILPPSIAEALKKSPGTAIAKKYPGVTVVFAEVCDFARLTENMDPIELVQTLNDVFTPWDKLASDCDSGVEKIKSFGAVWMGASGLPTERPEHAELMINFVLCALDEVSKLNAKRVAEKKPPIAFRVGVHSGSVVAGVIGFLKFCFDLWGDTVNVASRMETNGVTNRIQVSPTTLELVRDKWHFESRGLVPLKGKGEVECFLLSEGQQPTHRLTPDPASSSLPFLRDLNF